MAVDRGGLEYTIRVINEFSGPLRQFRTELVSARKSFRRFRKELRDFGSGTRVVNAALKEQVRSLRAETLALNTSAASRRDNLAALRQQNAALRATAASNRASITSLKQQNAARRQQNALLKQQNAVLKRTAAAQARLGRAGRKAAGGIDRASAAARRGQAAFGGLALTVRRLFTTLVFFTAARFALEGIRNLIAGTIQFAAAIETAELGIATLFTTIGQVTDASGKLLSGTDALTEGVRISAAQLKKLRIAGLQTAATFDQLLVAFQTGLAPGLRAGLQVDQIRKLTIQISQAASAINLEQGQLAEEIRSILAGTISIRRTRIAASLGITNEDIKQAKKAGNLFGFLQEKFAGFTTAGTRALNTFNVILANTTDALLLVSASGAEKFFVSLKEVLEDVKDALITINEEADDIELTQEVVLVFKTVFDSLSRAVERAKELSSELTFADLVAAMESVALIVDIVSTVLTVAFSGALQGARDLEGIFRTIGRAVAGLVRLSIINNEDLTRARQLVIFFARAFVVVKGIRLVFFLLFSKVALLVGLVVVLAAVTRTTEEDVQKLADSIVGIEDAKPEGVFEVLSAELRQLTKDIGQFAGTGIAVLLQSFRAGLFQLKNLFVTGLATLAELIKTKLVGGFATGLAAIAVIVDAGVTAFIRRFVVGINTLTILATAAFKVLGQEVGRALFRAFGDNVKGLTQFIEDILVFTGVNREVAKLASSFISLNREIPKARTFEELAEAVKEFAKADLEVLRSQVEEFDRREKAEAKQARRILDNLGKLSGEEQKASDKRLVEIAKQSKAEEAAIGRRSQAVLDGLAAQSKAQIALNELQAEQVGQDRRAFVAEGGEGFTDPALRADIETLASKAQVIADRVRAIFAELGVEIPAALDGILDDVELGEILPPEKVEKTKAGFTELTNFLKGQADRLAAEISSAIVDAFDPNTDVNAKERLIAFLKSFAKEAIAILLQIAIARAIALGGGGAAGGGQAGSGGVTGGRVHSKGVGFARGGSLTGMAVPHLPSPRSMRPRGLDPRDTVPIWVQPKEWIIRKSSSELYGNRVMRMINLGMLDPMALKVLAGQRPSVIRRSSRSIGRGFQLGGSVSSSRTATPGASAPGTSQGVVGAVIVSDEQAMDRLISGGRNALLDFISEESQTINGLLS